MNYSKIVVRKSKRGFLLFEALIAMTLFAIMAVGYTKVLSVARRNSMLVEQRMAITSILDNALTEVITAPLIEEGENRISLEENNIELYTIIEPMEIENEEGRILQQMFRVEISAVWYLDGRKEEEMVEGWRYARLYNAR